MARADNETGRVAATEILPSVTIVLKPSASQEAELTQLLAEQQEPSSPNYHRWLTPQEYADRFGASASDIQKITNWLDQQNLHVTGVSPSRNSISFSGAAGDVEKAFQTELHRYEFNGEQHFANSKEPTIPTALDVVVRSIHGLTDMRLKPRLRRQSVSDSSAAAMPRYTSTSGKHYLSPDDFAVIYNVKPLHDAGYDGSGQKIVIAGQTQIDLTDTRNFRARFQLPANDPETVLVPNLPNPGTVKDETDEANLDIQWAGAVAPNAKILYVYSSDVMDAVKYAIDQNLAPVISVSYGLCEPMTSQSDAITYQTWARQANLQGITWVNASGDSGGADCVTSTSTRNGGPSVDLPAAVPEVTGLGGTTFNDGVGSYWNTTNAANGASAIGYIPEVVWNDSTAGDPAAGGGGKSSYFAKPSWQTGAGVPSDNSRFVPDVSLSSSAVHVGYMVYTGGKTAIIGGTSAATPSFAGIATLINQYLVATGAQAAPGLGNMNARLYALAQTAPAVFHDVTSGDNIVTVTCGQRSRNCVAGAAGYSAGIGYDPASGLGSVDAYRLAVAWKGGVVSRSAARLSLISNVATARAGDTVALTATVNAGSGTPTGAVTFRTASATLGSAGLVASASGAAATLSVSGSQLGTGAVEITAQYGGDATFDIATASTTVMVLTGTQGAPSISKLTNGASFQPAYAPGIIVSIFGSALAAQSVSAGTVPLPTQLGGVAVTINGVSAPLYYVSPSQLNVQIPYETPVGQQASVVVSTDGGVASSSIPIVAAAPGLFADANGMVVPSSNAARGQVLVLYVTGPGAVTPSVATGAAPGVGTALAQLPRPAQNVAVSVGGVSASVEFVGIPAGLVGVTQINCRIGANTPTGTQAVLVSVGNLVSSPANVTVAQ